jgi:hypothetical protein
MSIARVVDHLYTIGRNDDKITVHFLTSRTAFFLPIFVVSGFCGVVVWGAFHWRWNDNVISGLIGGSISLIATTCFCVADDITRYVVTIEPHIVSLQRHFEGIPVGAKKTYHRLVLTDLGVYPHENRGVFRSPRRLGRLCLWANGRSIQLESYFPISEGAALANDLRAMGIQFTQTFPAYDEDHLLFAGSEDYVSF